MSITFLFEAHKKQEKGGSIIMRYKFKRAVSLLLVLIMVAGFLPVPAHAAKSGFTVGSGSWTLNVNVPNNPNGPSMLEHYHETTGNVVDEGLANWRIISNTPATKTTEGEVTFGCIACDTQKSFKIPVWNDSMYLYSVVAPEYYDGNVPVTYTWSIPTPAATVRASDGTVWCHDHLISGNIENKTAISNAGVFTLGTWTGTMSNGGMEDDNGVEWPQMKFNIISGTMTPTPSSIHIKPRPVTLSVPSSTFQEKAGSKVFLLENATGSNILSKISNITFPNYTGATTKTTVYVHPVTGLNITDDGTKATMVGDDYESDQTGERALSSVTEPGIYTVSAVLPLLAQITPYSSNYNINTSTIHPAGDVIGRRYGANGEYESWFAEEFKLIVAPKSLAPVYVQEDDSGLLDVYPSSSLWNFYGIDESNENENFKMTAGTKTLRLFAMPKSSANQSLGISIVTLPIEVKKWTVDRINGTPTASNPTPTVGTAFADLGLPSTVNVIFETPAGHDADKTYGMNNVKVKWDSSTWNPSNPAQQVVTGHLDLDNDPDASAIMIDPHNVTVQVTITPQALIEGNVEYPNKTVEWTGSPIRHEITSAVGVASTTYRYVSAALGYDSATPPTNVGTYQVTATFTMQAGYEQLAPATSILTITAKQQQLPAGSKPVIDLITPTSITLKPAEGEGTWEYGKVLPNGSVQWQDELLFDGLVPNTKYEFVQRLKGNPPTIDPSETSEKTEGSTMAPTVQVDVAATAASVKYPETIELSARTTHNLGARATVSYQWYKEGVPVSGATQSTMTLVETTDSGTYTCEATITLGDYSTTKMSDSLTVEITAGSIADLLPENWKDYLVTDPITYGQTLADTNIRLDMARLLADNPAFTKATTVAVRYATPTRVPTVLSSVSGAGTYGLVLTSSDPNYPGSTPDTLPETALTVNPAPLTVKLDDFEIQYGDAEADIEKLLHLTYTGFVNRDTAASLGGTLTHTSTYNTQWQDIPEGGKAEVTIGGLTSDNYTITFEPGTMTIRPRTIYIVPDYNQSKQYGAADPAFKISALNIGSLPADVQTAINTGIASVPVTREAGEEIGTYEYNIPTTTVGNFAFTRYMRDVVGTFEITKRKVPVVWEIAADDENPAPDTPEVPNVPENPDKDWTFDRVAFALENEIRILGAADADSGEFGAKDGLVSAYYYDKDHNKVPLKIKFTANGVEAAFDHPGYYFGDADDDSAGSGNYELIGDLRQFLYFDPTKTENVTFPTASSIFVGDKLGDSTLTGGNGGDNGNGTYAWKEPDFVPELGTWLYDVVFTPSADDAADYSTERGYDPATNTITRKVPVTVNDLQAVDPDQLDITTSKVYDGTSAAEIDASKAITVAPGDDVTVTASARYDTPDAGTNKKIYVKIELSGPDAGKYTAPAEFTVTGEITPAPLTIKANDANQQFGDLLGDTGITVTGLVTGESIADLSGTLTYDYDGYNRWDDVFDGTKTITVSGLSSTNYDITYETGTLQVSKRVVGIIPDVDNYKFFGDPDPVFSYLVDYGYPGTAPDKVKAEIDSNPVVITRDPGEDVGQYSFVCNMNDTTNFTWVVDDSAKFSINARAVELTWVGVDKAYYEDGTNQSGFIAAWYQDVTGKKVYARLQFTQGASEEAVPFTNKGEYLITAINDSQNYDFINPTHPIFMMDESDREKLSFPFAIPILKGEDLGKSNLVGGSGNGTFAWVDPTTVPEETGAFPVRFTPADDEDFSEQPGYDATTNTVIRDVEVEVWDEPVDLDDPALWDEMQKNGIFDKLYDAVTDSPLTGAKVDTLLYKDGHYHEVLVMDGLIAKNVNTPQLLQKTFLKALYKERYRLFLDLVGYNLLTMNTTGTFASKDVADDVALHMELSLTGPAARLFKLTSHDTKGDISQIMLMAVANDQRMTNLVTPFGAGVTFPDTLNRTEPAGYTWQDPAGTVYTFGLRNPDTMADLKGTLDYKFVAFKADGTEVPYSIDEMYAVPVWIIPSGLSSDNYKLSFFPGRLYAPNIFDPSEDPNWPTGRPPAPTVKSTTTTTIEVNPINGGQYSIDGGKTWQNSPLFEGLVPNTTYPIIQRIPDKNNPGEYLVSDPTNAKTRDPNDNPNRPDPPQIKDKTDTTIEVKPIPDGEYSIDGGKTWQDNPVFSGLTPDTEYEIIQRIPDNENPDEYLVSDPTKVRTDTEDPDKNKPPKPVIKEVTDTTIEVNPIPGGQYSIDDGKTWQDSPIFSGLTPDTEYEIKQRIPNPENPDEYLVSDPTTAKTDPDPNSNKPPKPTIKDVTDTTIEVNPIPDGEYSIDGGETWQDSPVFDGLDPDTEYEIIQRVPDPENPGEYIESDPTTVKTDPEDPNKNKPPKPVVEDKNENTIVLKPIPDGQYSIDGGKTWQDSPIFPGLKPGTEYEIKQRVPDPNHPGEYIESDPIFEKTDEPSSNNVPDPVVVDKKPTSITLLPINNGEYSVDGGMTWQPAPYFPGLKPNTKYDVVQRVPNGSGGFDISKVIPVTTPSDQDFSDIKIDKPTETIDYPNGKYEITDPNGRPLKPGDPITPGTIIHVKDPSTGAETDIQIPPRPAAPDVSLDNETGIINTKPDMEYSPDGGKTWYPAPDGLDVNDIVDGEIWVRYPATDDNFSSEITKIPIHRPDPPILGSVGVSKPGASDGSIIGTTDEMEYSTDGGKTWRPCPNGSVSGLPQGTYLVRYKGTKDHLASLPATVVIGVRRPIAIEDPDDSDQSADDKYGHWVQPGRPNNFNNNKNNVNDLTNILDGDVALSGMAGCPSEPYTDIDRTQWFHDACDFTISNRLMIGFNAHEWGPTRQMTRFQMVQVLYRLAGSPVGYSLEGVADVPRDSWIYNALAWAYSAGMVKGVTEELFAPVDSITYQQMATMIYNFCNIYGLTYVTGTATTSYNADEVADYAKAPMTAIAATGIFNVHGATSVSATATMSRATAAQIITNFCTLYNNQMRSNDNITGATQSIYTNPGVMSSLGVLFS